nr:phage late control D family protein [Mycobacterium sp. UM_NZ2]
MVKQGWLYETPSGAIESFYLPAFRIEAGPAGDTASFTHVLQDVSRVTYKDSVNQVDSFEFTVSNGDWQPGPKRYTDLFPKQVDGARLSLLPGAWVRLWMGYGGDLAAMLTGRVASVSVAYSPDGGVTLAVRALSGLDAFRKVTVSHNWAPPKGGGKGRITDSEVAEKVIARNDVEPVIPSSLSAIEQGEPSIAQTNETDIAFLARRAKERGYVVLFREVGRFGGAPSRKVVWFGPSNLMTDTDRQRLGEPERPYRLVWGGSLTEFRPTVNLSTTTLHEVTLSLWDRQAKKKVPIKYSLRDLWNDEGLNADLSPLLAVAPTASRDLSEKAVQTAGQARQMVRSALRDNFLQVVTGDGSTVGQPLLRAGSMAEIAKVGVPFDGMWFLTGSTHTIDDNGYRTSFTCRREHRVAA